MKNKFGIKDTLRKFIIFSGIAFSLLIVGLALTPNYACGCGDIENGTKLTYFVNGISKTVIGRKLF